MDATQAGKLVALTDANRLVGELAIASNRGTQDWQFFCECGQADCRALVVLTLAEFDGIKDSGNAVLAAGHLVDQKAHARVLREHAQALRAEAEHQVRRARKNRGT
jgi:hypothetical protein